MYLVNFHTAAALRRLKISTDGLDTAMTSNSAADINTHHADVVHTLHPGPELKAAVENLTPYFAIESIAEKEGYSKVECLDDISASLEKVKEEFKKEFVPKVCKIFSGKTSANQSVHWQVLDLVRKSFFRDGTKFYLSRAVHLLVFQSGWSSLEKLVAEDDCMILIPVAISGLGASTIRDRTTQREMAVTFEVMNELAIAGRCSIWLPQQSKIVCVVLCVAAKERS